MTYKGRVKNGVVVLDRRTRLPEGAEVRVSVEQPRDGRDSLSRLLLKYAGKAKGLPRDLARNHDHYLYGTPKRS
ncbi:MAG: hypothetical protein FJ290_12550 [Planctomycetes bacterium]|nr:hypothetical protein [Planctomycetota bacterium]